MEKIEKNTVMNGGIKLPIGYRFHPTDEELVVHYLKRKVLGIPLPASVIPHFDVFQTDPWCLPGDFKEKRYFFSKRNGNEKKVKISAGSGYWKSSGKAKQILASGLSMQKQVIGLIKTLNFYHENGNFDSKASHPTKKTPWIMHEYHLLDPSTNYLNSTQSMSTMGMENWVIYHIFQKKKKPSNKKNGLGVSFNIPCENGVTTDPTVMAMPSCIDFTVDQDQSDPIGPPQPSDSSEINEIICCDANDQEEITSRSTFSSFYSNCMKK